MKAAVVGAGITGLFSAYYLQKNGVEVTVFDPLPAGARSVHAAGIIEPSRAYRTNTLAFLLRAARYWSEGTCRIRSIDPRWLASAFLALGRGEPAGSEQALSDLARESVDAYRHLAAARNDFAFSEGGLLERYSRSDRFLQERDAALARRGDVPVEVREEEGGSGSLFFPTLGWLHTSRCVERLVRELDRVEWVRAPASRIGLDGSLRTGGDTRRFDRVVVATGVASRELGLPLTAVRGYGWHLKTDAAIRSATILVDQGVAFAPFEGEVKATGGWDFDLSSSVDRAARILEIIRVQLPGSKVVDFNHGWRPCTPDGLPVAGRREAVVIANGGFRLGWSFAPGLGKVAADLATDAVENDGFLARHLPHLSLSRAR